MRVIAFPTRRLSPADAAAMAALEAALDGDATGPEAQSWRELRADVRSLTEPIDPDFARVLEHRPRVPEQPTRRRRPLAGPILNRRRIALGSAGVLGVALAAVIAGGALTASHHRPLEAAPGPANATSAPPRGAASAPAETRAAEPSFAPGGEAAGEAGGRLQQLGASITLGAGGEGVQQVAARVAQAATAAGGFVASSRVQSEQGSPGEALMTLSLPSAKLAATLAQLQRIAPVRAETQSLQDVTGEYDSAGARLAAARGERAALLKALAGATTAAAIESLHARLAAANQNIAAAERQRAAISRHASRSQVEVTVLGEAHHAGGLTLGSGLSDAGEVLTVSLAALLIAAAVLVPVALAIAALLLGTRLWRRQRRERMLGTR